MEKISSTLATLRKEYGNKELDVNELSENPINQFKKWLDEAIKTLIVCRKHHAKLIINDNPELAAEIGADGVHLGKGDMNLSEARKIIGTDMILGATANTFEDIVAASNHEIDYIGLGPFRFTSTKKVLSPILGLNGFRETIQLMDKTKITLPIIAIGGIMLEDIPDLFSVGVHGIAIASAINISEDPTRVANLYYKTSLL